MLAKVLYLSQAIIIEVILINPMTIIQLIIGVEGFMIGIKIMSNTTIIVKSAIESSLAPKMLVVPVFRAMNPSNISVNPHIR